MRLSEHQGRAWRPVAAAGQPRRVAAATTVALVLMVVLFNAVGRLDPAFPLSMRIGTYLKPALLLGGAWLLERLGFPRLSAMARATGLLATIVLATYVLSFQLQAFGRPLADPWLYRADMALGVDWPWIVRTVGSNGLVFNLFGLAYHAIPLQLLAITISLGWTRAFDRLDGFVALTALSSLIGVLVAAAFPGIGMLEWVDRHDFSPFSFAAATPAQLVFAMRRHDLAAVDLAGLNAGMLTFPSFHALYACLCVAGLRRTPFFRIGLVLNAAMAVGAIPFGAHYVADILGGVATFGLALALIGRLDAALGAASAWLRRGKTIAPPMPVVPSA